MLITTYTFIAAHLLGVRDSVTHRLNTRSDSGLGTLEVVIIALGLFTLAGLAVAVLTGAVQSRLDQIN